MTFNPYRSVTASTNDGRHPTYVTDIHQELRSPQGWSNPGLKSVVMLAWGVTLRQLNQYQTPTGKGDIMSSAGQPIEGFINIVIVSWSVSLSEDGFP